MISFLAVAVLALGSVLNVFDRIHAWLVRVSPVHPDEVFGMLAVAAIAAAAFAARERRAGAREAELRVVGERRYREVVERVPAITYTWDYSGPIGKAPAPYVSPQIEKILGYTAEEWMKDPTRWMQAIHSDDRELVMRISEESDRTGQRFEAEYRMISKDGRIVWVHDESVVVEWDQGGRPKLAHGVMFDITRRKEAEEALQDTENRYRTMVERVPAVSYVWDAGYEPGSAPATYISPQIVALLGYTAAEWAADPRLWEQRAHPDDAPRVLAAWEDAVRRGMAFTMEYRMFSRQGALVWVRDEAVPVAQGSRGRPVYQGVMFDITEQKTAEEQLRATEARFRTLVEQIPAITFIEDAKTGRNVYISPQIEAVLGYTPKEWLANPKIWEDSLHPEDRDWVIAQEQADSGETWSVDYRTIARDGRVVWLHNHSVLIRDDQGEPLAWQGVAFDITELKLVEEKLRAAEVRYRSLVEQLPAIVYVDAVDDVSTAVYVSPQYERLTGYSPQERTADPDLWVKMLHPDDRDRVLAESRRTNETGEAFNCDYRMVRKDGREVWVRDHAVLVGRENGSPGVWQGVLTDITENRLAEEALGRRDRILEVAGYAAEMFLNSSSWTDPIDEVLERLGVVVGASRSYVYDNNRGADGRVRMSGRYEWRAEGVPSTLDQPFNQGARYKPEFDRWQRILAAGEVIHGLTRDFPPAERPELEAEDVLSQCVVPVFVAGEWWGFIGFDQCDQEREWQRAEIDALRVIATTLGAAIGRERAEQRLSETEARYRTLVEQIPAITYIEDPTTAKAIYISPQLETVLGYSADEWGPGKYFETLHPDDRERVRTEDERTNRTGEPYRVEFRQRAKDGHWVWLRDEAVLIRDEMGHPLYWQGVRFDVTAQKEAEQQLREAEERYRTLVEQMPAIIYLDGPPGDNATIWVSPQVEELLGYSAEEWIAGRLWFDRLHPEDRDGAIEADRRANETGEPSTMEYRLLHRDGHVVWVLDRSILVTDASGTPSHFQGVYFDITAQKQAEDRSRRAEERYRTLVEQLPAVVYLDEVRTEPGKIPTLYVSPQIKDVLGYSPEEWIGDPTLWARRIHPEDRERSLEADRRHLETGEPMRQEIRMYAADGTLRWIRDEAIVISDENGEPRWSQGILLDITEQKLAEERLADAEERYRSLIETIPAATYVDSADALSQAIYMSPQVEQIFGYTPDEWKARPELWEQGLHPDDRDDVVARVERLNAEGIPYEAEYRYRHHDGRWVWVRDQAVMIRDEEGRPRFTQGVMFDVTERREAEEQLHQTEQRFRAIVEHIPVAVYLDLPDDSMTTVYVSPQIEQIMGVTPERYTSDPNLWLELMVPSDRERVARGYLRAIEDRRPWRSEYRVIRPDGREVWVHDETTFLYDEEGQPTFIQGVMFDVTEQKLAEQALRDSEQREREAAERLRTIDEMKNTFLAAVSHELRSPLTSILGLSLTLERQGELLDEDRSDLLERLAANARKLDRLLKDLLDIDRLQRGIVEPQYRITDVGALAARTFESLDSLADRRIVVRVEPVVIAVDPAKVERIVENLLVNAARHTDTDHHIWLLVEPLDGGVLIAVDDDGPGVPVDLREAIFEPFRQGPTVSKASPGTGIGLSLVARFAQLHGGRAWVEERDGGGASFRVFLPGGAGSIEDPADWDRVDAG